MKRKLLAILLSTLVLLTSIPLLGLSASSSQELPGASDEQKETLGASAEEVLGTSAFPLARASLRQENPNDRLRVWFDKPLKFNASHEEWQQGMIPIGNGHMGGMIFGDIEKERVHFNEKTLWTGGPSNSRPNHIGSNRPDFIDPTVIDDFLLELDDKSSDVFGMTRGHGETAGRLTRDIIGSGWDRGMGMYQDFGDIYLDFAASGLDATATTNYERDLDLNTAIASVNFEHNNVTYTREYFNSYPDNVLVMRLTASEAGKLSFDVSTELYGEGGWFADKENVQKVAANGTITVTGNLRDNQEKFEAQIRVLNDDGTLTENTDGTITVADADSVTIILACGTDYKNEYPHYRGDDPHAAVTKRIDDATTLGYETLLDRHLDDYTELFGRVTLDLGGEMPTIPTNELVENYQQGDYKQSLEELVFQFGRYLTIAGSREGALPTNLNGVWMIGSANAFWNADYHFNMNFQMNYWPTLSSNLPECAVPLNDYIESLREPGRVTAEASSGVASGPGEENGFLVHTVNNIYGTTAPYGVQEFGWNIGGSSWIMQNVYDYYRYTQDEQYLEDVIYPMLREMSTFWENYLRYSPYQDRMVVSPSVSAEQGPTVNGSTYDQSLVWQTFEETIEAANVLGVDQDRVDDWKALQDQLEPIIIGEDGQVKEWYEETKIGYAQAGDLAEITIPNFNAGYSGPHRHLSHLVGLYPGNLISKETPEDLEAAIVSLEHKGLLATGWAKAWRVSAWARTGNVEWTYNQLKELLGGGYAGIMTNLMGSHGQGTNHKGRPVLQIETNYGATAGITEMLMQSQLGYIQFLPTIPSDWNTGFVDGLLARGNFELTMDWENGTANYFAVTSNKGNEFIGEYPDISTALVYDEFGNTINPTIIDDDKISFDTTAGTKYFISMDGEIIGTYPVTGVTLNTNDIELAKGDTATLIATVQPALATNKNVQWAVQDVDIATIGQDGTLKALSLGTTIVRVVTEDGGFTEDCTVTVTPPTEVPVSSVTVVPDTLTLKLREAVQLSAIVEPKDATNKTVLWRSEYPEIARVSSNGLVTAVSTGTTRIFATSVAGGNIGVATVTVESLRDEVASTPSRSRGPIKGAVTSQKDSGPVPAGIPAVSEKPVTDNPLTAAEAQSRVKKAIGDAPEDKAAITLKLSTFSSISSDVMETLRKEAKDAGVSLTLYADTLVDGKVNRRIYLPASLTGDLLLLNNLTREEILEKHFRTYFINDLKAYCLAQQEDFSEPVEHALRLAENMDKTNLVVYHYDAENNTYAALENTGSFVDSNGFFHFKTVKAGDFIVSDGTFVRK